MNEKDPKWFDLLRERPIFAERTFTRESIERIEREAELGSDAGGKRARRSPLAWGAITAAVAAILIAAGVLRGDGGSVKGELASWFGIGHETVETVETMKPPPPGTEGPAQTATADPSPSGEPSELAIEPQEWNGYLGDQLPFSPEDVESISVYGSAVNAESTVPAERMYVILQGITWLDLGTAEDALTGEADAVLRLHLRDTVYAIPYDSKNNAFLLEGRAVHPDGQTTLLLYSFVYPGSRYSWFDAFLEKARLEMETEGGLVTSKGSSIPAEKFYVEGMDYLGWERKLAASEGFREMDTWDGAAGIPGKLGLYEQEGILQADRRIVFQNDQYETADGIRVGSTSEQVAGILGEPNIKTESYWGYRIDDYVKFHLYFETIGEYSFVKYMVLSMPL